jgi:hypothetical protein
LGRRRYPPTPARAAHTSRSPCDRTRDWCDVGDGDEDQGRDHVHPAHSGPEKDRDGDESLWRAMRCGGGWREGVIGFADREPERCCASDYGASHRVGEARHHRSGVPGTDPVDVGGRGVHEARWEFRVRRSDALLDGMTSKSCKC